MKQTLFRRFIIRYTLISLVSLLFLALMALSVLYYAEVIREKEYLTARTYVTADLIEAVASGEASLQEMNRQLRSVSSSDQLNIYLMQSLPSANTEAAAAEHDSQEYSNVSDSGQHMHGSGGSPGRGMRESFQPSLWMERELRTWFSDRQLSDLWQNAVNPVVVRISQPLLQFPLMVGVQKTSAGLLFIYRDPTASDQSLRQQMPLVSIALLLAFLLIGLISSVVMSRMYRGMLRPLKDISLIADRIISGDYSQRLKAYPETELQLISESVNRMLHKLDKLETARLDFTAQLAHELRTPLTILRMSVQGVKDGVISEEEQNEFFDVTLQEIDRLELLTQNLIDLASAEGGDFPIEPEMTDITELVQSVVTEIRPLCLNHHQCLNVRIEEKMTGVLDGKRIRQVLLNLLSNSIKFAGDKKQIDLEAKLSGGTLRVTVRDDGPGIAEHERHILFDKYQKWGRRAGAGLGLAISKEIIEAHGGRITVLSDGTSFTQFDFYVPV